MSTYNDALIITLYSSMNVLVGFFFHRVQINEFSVFALLHPFPFVMKLGIFEIDKNVNFWTSNVETSESIFGTK